MISRAIWVEKKHVWKINLQKNGVRKSFYSSVPGDKGRKICAQNATSWLSGACPFSVSERTTVDTVFERYLQDKALETTNIYTIRNRYNNHIKPIIGKVPVMLLTKQDLKRVIYAVLKVPQVYTLVEGGRHHVFYGPCKRPSADVKLMAGCVSSLPCLGYGDVSVGSGRALYRDDRLLQLTVEILYIQRAENFLQVTSRPGSLNSLFHFRVLTFVFPIFARVIPPG